ncbi:bifunctional 4-hydroxy-2-oxoglutarate aldolase/2-dehydro-3-deoxy-phosphogluconate aldolase [Pusillimonas sp. ANT_WB101]|uniref:bifunctional 4-hydroxy-2-oxoglutarate aldolase/2-dehydro-3-deoxy-phosphogluconate aldolase n=1 Tax=Pusillimonas sp. ANT_WB101 TaxID=2597356 RepID=UPI0011EE745D|nr:bifunctional 4-hydroxy-2-oxoglutarate aldolase/2-dehydro-3-deoxy-phosphogluconate aldolase [Pusillimonas sp. ANT_WB101]KAA0910565.1 bifunctional 4-hydroxy-2-oxoglutarate aldolase/2-dehydro-3-deoxy-phosphogluconate aldolase [Pusillimonas sp. ANT_WB101]
MNALELLEQSQVMPVMVIQDITTAVDLARALIQGGVRTLEITLRSEHALDAIRLISQEVPDALVGAGTVRTPAQFEAAIEAGAAFCVSPGLTPSLARSAHQFGVPFLPGIATASESMFAADQGFSVQKLFPAEAVGGVGLLKALYGPLPDIVFCPTGGINATNARQYLALPNVKCVGGSWLTPEAAVAEKRWDVIAALAREACT